MGFLDWWVKNVTVPTTKAGYDAVKEPESEVDKRNQLAAQSSAAGGFADLSQGHFNQLGPRMHDQYEALGRQASGRDSFSRESLRQGLQQLNAQQRSMAAGASPNNAAMAARTAANNMNRAGYGMSGQAALAGIQERRAAQEMQQNFLNNWRQQESQNALGNRQAAISALTGGTPEKSWLEKYGGAITSGAGLLAMSDERVKKNVRKAGDESKRILSGLKSYRYDYKDEKHGKGSQFGVMAQDLEKVGLGHAVEDTREGKAVHGGKLALANTAMLADLGKRMSKLEKKGK